MTDPSSLPASKRNLPIGAEVFLDHVGHFVPDPEAASAALTKAGFTPTPLSVQVNPDPDGGPPKLTGTGNTCVMLERGYLEFLFKTADTSLGREFDASAARYDGIHLAAFAIDDSRQQHERVAVSGFKVQPLVLMQRPVETEHGPGVAGFSIVRIVPGEMPEGRIQLLRHLTEDTVWQKRWLSHPNTAVALTSLTVVESDIGEAAGRFHRLLGGRAIPNENGTVIELDRGTVEILSPGAWHARWPQLRVPADPYMGQYGIAVRSLAEARSAIKAAGLVVLHDNPQSVAVRFPPEVGYGVWTFHQE
ncbi:MAG: VOC family protein [Hyphomicrobiaceae bacterium]